ncbi:PCTP-like protein [Acipenser ruthenus]|uniref:PCTP-like protein n=1 Tax=Acipenser ruthenus TaxID=7906 RepID=A0A444UZW3_ACIRT|nr:PCTP-like protein [Acipenser ruthenus]
MNRSSMSQGIKPLGAVLMEVSQSKVLLAPIKCRMVSKDVSSNTMYDVLHDTEYRKKWDSNVIETFDIGKLTVNADVGYYSCKSGRRTGVTGWRLGTNR